MADDIVKRLTRAMEGKFDGMLLDLLPEAADEIDALRGLIIEWADADEADHAALGMEMGAHRTCECTPWCALRKAVGR